MSTPRTRAAARAFTGWILVAANAAAMVAYPFFRALNPVRGLVILVASTTHLILIWGLASGRVRIDRRAIGVVSLVSIAAMCAAHPVGTDLWSYHMNGRLVTEYRASPYVAVPADYPGDPIADRTEGWADTPSPYGPGLVGVAVVVASVTGDNEGATRVAWQVLGAGAAGGIVVGMIRRRVPASGIAAVGLSPTVLYEGVHLAHIDITIGALCAAGIMLLGSRRSWALMLLAGGALIKAPVAIGWLVAVVWITRVEGRRALRTVAPSAVLATAAVVGAGGMTMLRPMYEARDQTNAYTVWNVFRGAWRVAQDSLVAYPFEAGPVITTGAGVLALLFVSAAAFIVWASGDVATCQAAVVAVLAAWLMVALYTSPWSFLWIIAPVAGWAAGGRDEVGHLAARAMLTFIVVYLAVTQWWLVTYTDRGFNPPGSRPIEWANRSFGVVFYAAEIGLVIAGVGLAVVMVGAQLRARRTVSTKW